jgi:Mannosyltransferase (PIG-V)
MAWDAEHHARIAQYGYDSVADGYRFFPLFPLMVRAVSVLTLGNVTVAALVIANVCALGLGLALYRLVLRETGRDDVARLSVWLLLLSPAAVPLVMGFSESLGLLALVLAFLCLRTRRWLAAAVCAAVLGATWSVGIIAVPALLVEAARGARQAGWGERLQRLGVVVAPIIGAGAYLVWVQATIGDARQRVFAVQVDVYDRSFRDPVVRVWDAGYDLFFGHHASGVPFPWALLCIALTVVVARRLPAGYTVLCASVLLLALSSDNIDSFERYALRAFPLVIAGALLLRSERSRWLVLSGSAAGLLAYGLVTFVGANVP